MTDKEKVILQNIADYLEEGVPMLDKLGNEWGITYPTVKEANSANAIKQLINNDENLTITKEEPAIWLNVNKDKGICSNCFRLDGIDPLAKFCRYCGKEIRRQNGDK